LEVIEAKKGIIIMEICNKKKLNMHEKMLNIQNKTSNVVLDVYKNQ